MNNNPDIKEAIKNVIQRLAEVGYEHDDLNWRHVGLYQTSRSINAVLFDLARVSFKIHYPFSLISLSSGPFSCVACVC